MAEPGRANEKPQGGAGMRCAAPVIPLARGRRSRRSRAAGSFIWTGDGVAERRLRLVVSRGDEYEDRPTGTEWSRERFGGRTDWLGGRFADAVEGAGGAAESVAERAEGVGRAREDVGSAGRGRVSGGEDVGSAGRGRVSGGEDVGSAGRGWGPVGANDDGRERVERRRGGHAGDAGGLRVVRAGDVDHAADRRVPRPVSPGRRPVRLTRRGRLVVLALVLLVGALVGFLGAAPGRAADPPKPAVTAVVQPGDTLWSFAERNLPHWQPRAAVVELKRLNDLEGYVIHPGQRLALPARR